MAREYMKEWLLRPQYKGRWRGWLVGWGEGSSTLADARSVTLAEAWFI